MTKPDNPFRYFYSLPEIIRLVVMMYVKCPLSLWNVEDLLAQRGIDVSALGAPDVRIQARTQWPLLALARHPCWGSFRIQTPLASLAAQDQCGSHGP